MLPAEDNSYLPLLASVCSSLWSLVSGEGRGALWWTVPRGPRLKLTAGGLQSSDASPWAQMNPGFLLASFCVPRKHVLFLTAAAVWVLVG